MKRLLRALDCAIWTDDPFVILAVAVLIMGLLLGVVALIVWLVPMSLFPEFFGAILLPPAAVGIKRIIFRAVRSYRREVSIYTGAAARAAQETPTGRDGHV